MTKIYSSVRLPGFGMAIVTLLVLDPTFERRARVDARAASDFPAAERPLDRASTDRIAEAYGRLPLSFERNAGQTDDRVEFLARGQGYTLFLNKGAEAVLSLRAGNPGPTSVPSPHLPPSLADPSAIDPPLLSPRRESESSAAALKLRLVGANVESSGQGQSELSGKVNYLVGTSPQAWRSGIATYGRVHYRDVYPGIDVIFYGNQRQLEYDFIVEPGANPDIIVLELENADRLDINPKGELVATLGEREVVQRKPVIYQELNGVRNEIRGRYVLVSRTRAAFQLDTYDRKQPLVIDPVLAYSTYLDGSISCCGATQGGNAIAVDGNGSVYVTGWTSAVDFPTTAGAFQTSAYDGYDVFVTKLDPGGASLAYSTYLGGTGSDSTGAIAIDAGGSAYITGATTSTDFPTTPGAFDTSASGGYDVFITKLDASGASLAYSTYLGGTGLDGGDAIAVDVAGSAFVTGYTTSADFPTTAGAFDVSPNGGYDGFVARLNPEGAFAVYSTYLGGSADDSGGGIAVDAGGRAHVTGATSSADFPTTAGAFDVSVSGGSDAFVTVLEATGAELFFSTYLGGSGRDGGSAIALDTAGGISFTGFTDAADFPTTAGAFDASANGFTDAFVAKLSPTGAELIYSTYYGGNSHDSSNSIAVDAAGNVYITGSTRSWIPTTSGAFQTSGGGGQTDGFVAKVDAKGALAYSTYLGGSSRTDYGAGIAVDAAGSAYVTGSTQARGFPTTVGAFDRSWDVGSEGSEAFVTKLDPSGAALEFSTFLGGAHPGGGAAASGLGISVDATGATYLTGATATVDFPTTAGAYDTTWNGGSSVFWVPGDAFVTKLNAGGTELVYSTYLGGSGRDVGNGIAVDAFGNAYVTGYTDSADFPTTVGAFDTSWNGSGDAFVAQLNSTGTALFYASYLGGSSSDNGLRIDLDGTGSAYVTGVAYSGDFPTTPGAFDTSWNGSSDVFVTKLDSAGTDLVYSTYLGGSGAESGPAIAVDRSGRAYIGGSTFSADFPATAGAFDTSWHGGGDAFVTRLDSSGAGLEYSTYLGGSGGEGAHGIAVDAVGSAYLTGSTSSADFPTTARAFDRTWNGWEDVFVTKVDPAGAVLVYSTYLGGASNEFGRGIAVDASGGVYLTGWTLSADFPTTAGAFDRTWNGGPSANFSDAFLTKLDMSGAGLEYSTYMGGTGADGGANIVLDRRRNAYLIGTTESADFPTTARAFDSDANFPNPGVAGTASGRGDAFVVKFSFLPVDADVAELSIPLKRAR